MSSHAGVRFEPEQDDGDGHADESHVGDDGEDGDDRAEDEGCGHADDPVADGEDHSLYEGDGESASHEAGDHAVEFDGEIDDGVMMFIWDEFLCEASESDPFG